MKILIIFLTCIFVTFGDLLGHDQPSFLKGKLISRKPSKVLEYLAALFEDDKHYCSGSVVSKKHILTVAACLKFFFRKNCMFPDFSRYSALVGSMDLINGGNRYHYEQVEIPNDYNFKKDDFVHNIGLITLMVESAESEIQDEQLVKISKHDVGFKELGQVSGWGQSPDIASIGLLSYGLFTTLSIKNRLCYPFINQRKIQETKLFCGYNYNRNEKFILEKRDHGSPFMNEMYGTVLGILSYFRIEKNDTKLAIFLKSSAFSAWVSEAQLHSKGKVDRKRHRIVRFDDIFEDLDPDFFQI